MTKHKSINKVFKSVELYINHVIWLGLLNIPLIIGAIIIVYEKKKIRLRNLYVRNSFFFQLISVLE